MEELLENTYVAANAGCGKTYTLIKRVLSLIDSGVNINRILLLTFTDNAAQEMRTRLELELVSVLPNQFAKNALNCFSQANIQTINSFAYNICKSFYEYSEFSNYPAIITDTSANDIYHDIFNSLWDTWASENEHETFFNATYDLGLDRNKWFEALKKIYKIYSLQNIQSNNIFFPFIDKNVNQDQIYIDQVLQYGITLSREYISKVNQHKFFNSVITHDDSLTQANMLLDIDFIRFNVWNKFDCVVVDEFQDTNKIQLDILEKLIDDTSENDLARLFAVGDYKQSIYGFRGVKINEIEKFVKNNTSSLKTLNTTFRNSKTLLESINNISSSLFNDYTKANTGRNDTENESHLKYLGKSYNCNSNEIKSEIAKDIAKEIYKLRDRAQGNLNYNEIAIIARDTSYFGFISNELANINVPYEIDSTKSIYEDSTFKTIINLLLSITDPRESISTVGILKSSFFNLTNDDLIGYIQSLPLASPTNIWCYVNQQYLKENKVSIALKKIQQLHNEYSFKTPLQALLQIKDQFDIHIFSTEVFEYMCNLALEFEAIYPQKSLFEFSKSLLAQFENKALSIPFQIQSDEESIKVMTIHKSKGLEFKTVFFIPGIIKKPNNDIEIICEKELEEFEPTNIIIKFNQKISDSRYAMFKDEIIENQNQEERRLMYVGLTRAKDNLYICMHRKNKKSPSKLQSGTDLLNSAI